MLWSHSRWNHYIQVLETNVFRISACLKQHLSPNPGTKVETVRPPKLCRQRCHKLKLALYFFLTSWKFISRSRCSRADVVLLNVKVPDSFHLPLLLFFFFFWLALFIYFYFIILYWFCHTSTWIRHGCTRVPHPKPPSHLPPRTIPLGHPSAPARSILYHASNPDWRFISYMILYMFQCHSPKSSHPLPLPQSP